MIVPHDVDTQGIKSHGFNHLQPMFPILNRNPRIMDFSSDEHRRQLTIFRNILGDICLDMILLDQRAIILAIEISGNGHNSNGYGDDL